MILQFILKTILKIWNILNSYMIYWNITLVDFVLIVNLFILLNKNRHFKWKYSKTSLTMLDGDISPKRSNYLLAAAKSHPDVMIFNLSQVLFHFKLHKWDEQHFLPLLWNAYSWIYNLCFKYMGLFLLICFNFLVILILL